MTAITFRWSEFIGVPAVGSVTVTRRSYRLEPETVFVPFSRTFPVRGEAVHELDPSLPGQGYELTWNAAGTTEKLTQVVLVPPAPADGAEILAHRLAVDPATLEPLGEEHELTAADLVARAEALTARIEGGEFTGAAGVGVESITDEDGDGVATVRLTSGEVSDLQLPRGPQGERGERGLTGEQGVKGDRGDTGPAPEVSWTGDRLTVGGQTGPSLTGPQGVKGDQGDQGPQGLKGDQGPQGLKGDRGDAGPANTLTIGTVTGGTAAGATLTGEAPAQTLSLVLPQGAKGDRGDTGPQGPPGVVSSASSYVIVGPGRPDQPSTTAGAITGSEPVGAEYRSTDGAQVGAWVWRRRPNGWTCPDLDTLNRYISADAALLPLGGEAVIRRIGSRVSLVLSGIPRAYNSVIFNIPDGFRSTFPLNIGGQAKMGGAGGVFQTVTYQGTGLGPRMQWGGNTIKYHGIAVADSLADVHASWHSNQAPPASLPGVTDLYSY